MPIFQGKQVSPRRRGQLIETPYNHKRKIPEDDFSGIFFAFSVRALP